MKIILAALLTGVSAPALAQSQPLSPATAPASSTCLPEHAAMGHCTLAAPAPRPAPIAPVSRSTCSPEHAAMGHCTLPAPAARPAPVAPQSSTTCLPEHAAMGHCTLPAPAARPAPVAPVSSSTCLPEHAAMGHCTPPATGQPQTGGDPHAGHIATSAAPPVAPPPPAAFSGPKHAADAVYGEAASAQAREQLRDEHGNILTYKLLVDQLEAKLRKGRNGFSWDAQGWYGGDINKLWIKSEGEGGFGESLEQAEVQALYSRAINPWFNLQGGVRYDLQPNPKRTHLVLGIQGLAPYWFEVDGALFLSNKGDLTARFEAEYDQRITQKLILQPSIEFDLAAQNVPELRIGAGLSTAEVGLRLRYEFVPEFAPYVGVEYERAFGNTADFARAAGEKVGGWSLLTGVRMWF